MSSGLEIIPSFRLRIHPEQTHFHLEITVQLYLTAEIWDTRAKGRYCIPWFVSSSCLAHSSWQKSKSYCQFSLWFCISCGVLTAQERKIPFSLAVLWFYYIHRSTERTFYSWGCGGHHIACKYVSKTDVNPWSILAVSENQPGVSGFTEPGFFNLQWKEVEKKNGLSNEFYVFKTTTKTNSQFK